MGMGLRPDRDLWESDGDHRHDATRARAADELRPDTTRLEPGLEASSFFEPPNCTFPFGTHIVAVEELAQQFLLLGGVLFKELLLRYPQRQERIFRTD